MGKYVADLAKHIPGLLDLAMQGMLDNIDTKIAEYNAVPTKNFVNDS